MLKIIALLITGNNKKTTNHEGIIVEELDLFVRCDQVRENLGLKGNIIPFRRRSVF